jgi:hypothetical protein
MYRVAYQRVVMNADPFCRPNSVAFCVEYIKKRRNTHLLRMRELRMHTESSPQVWRAQTCRGRRADRPRSTPRAAAARPPAPTRALARPAQRHARIVVRAQHSLIHLSHVCMHVCASLPSCPHRSFLARALPPLALLSLQTRVRTAAK